MEFIVFLTTLSENVIAQGFIELCSVLFSGNIIVDTLFLIFIGVWMKLLLKYIEKELKELKDQKEFNRSIQIAIAKRMGKGFKFN